MQFELPDGANHKEVEKAYILKLLQENGHNVSKVARISGRERSTLHRWINEWGLQRKLVPKETPAQPESPAPASAPPPTPTARLAPDALPNPAVRGDHLTPEIRAKLEDLQAAQRKRPGKSDGP